MQREIKFRAWDKSEKRMCQVSSLMHAQNGVDSGNIFDNKPDRGRTVGFLEREDAVLMQYTGLHDKSGRDICEADILSSGIGPLDVHWDGSAARWVMTRRYKNDFFFQDLDMSVEKLSAYEVIGNIYEHPELLN
jgi:hypothetical protein